MINLSNYPQYFLDYHEGVLDAAGKEELFAFLEKHPELKEEFESFEAITLEMEELSFPDKRRLHRHFITSANLTTRLIALMEGDLSESDRALMNEELKKDPSLKAEYDLLISSRLIPEKEISFPEKEKLYRHAKVISMQRAGYRFARIAAILLLMILSAWFILQNREKEMLVDKDIPKIEEKKNEISPSENISPENFGTELLAEDKAANEKSNEAKDNVQSAHKKDNQSQDKKQPRKINSELKEVNEFYAERPAIFTKDSIHAKQDIKENLAFNPAPVTAKEVISLPSGEYTREQLLEVFSEKELADLGIINEKVETIEQNGFWKIAEAGVGKIGEVTGTGMQLEKGQNTYALSAGKFSVSRRR